VPLTERFCAEWLDIEAGGATLRGLLPAWERMSAAPLLWVVRSGQLQVIHLLPRPIRALDHTLKTGTGLEDRAFNWTHPWPIPRWTYCRCGAELTEFDFSSDALVPREGQTPVYSGDLPQKSPKTTSGLK
jgi:hypothetical protein